MTDIYFGGMLPPGREARTEEDGSVAEPRPRVEGVVVGTASPLTLRLEPVDHHLAPAGTVCVGSYFGERLISRCALPEETAQEFLQMEIFERPVSLALNVSPGGPGLEGNLLALVPMSEARGEAEPSEPWRESVPGAGYENEVARGETEDDEEHLVGVFLGQVVRFEEDRKHPGSLVREAADMLADVVRGRIGDVVDRVIEDLTGPEVEPE